MATLANLIVNITANTADLSRTLVSSTTQIEQQLNTVGASAGRLSTFMDQAKGAFVGFVAAHATMATVRAAWRALTEFVGGSIRAYAEQEAATVKLTQALRSQGSFTPQLSRHYQDLAASFQKTTVFGDELLIEMTALLTQIGNVGPRQMRAALQASTDLAAGLGIDLRAATVLVGKAFAGETGSLSRYGIVVNEADRKVRGVTAVLDALHDKFGGQAQAAIQGYTGRTQQLANTWGDVKEQIGEVIVTLPLVEFALRKVQDATHVAADDTTALSRAWGLMSTFDVAGPLTALKILNESADAANVYRRHLDGIRAMPSPWKQAAETELPLLRNGLERSATQMAALTKRTEAAAAAAKTHARAISNLSEQLTGSKALTDLRVLEQVWRNLSKTQQANPVVVSNVLAAYTTLRSQVTDPSQLPRELETLERRHWLVASAVAGTRSAITQTIPVLVNLTDTSRALTLQTRELITGVDQWGRAYDFLLAQTVPVIEAQERVNQSAEESGSIWETVSGRLGQIAPIFDGLNDKFSQIATKVLRTVQAISERLAEGDWVGAVVAGVAAIGSAFGRLFGIGKEETKVNPVRQAFIDAAGGLDILREKIVAAAGTDALLRRLLDAEKVRDYEAAIRAVNEALEFQDHAMQILDETTQRYGFTIEELGPAFARQQLSEQALQLYQDWVVLNSAGIDTVAIATRMADSVNAYVQRAVTMGIEVPEAMRPMLQQMIDLGLFTDASGEKIGSLEDSGVRFSMTMSEGFRALIDEVHQLAEAIARGLGVQLAALPGIAADSAAGVNAGLRTIDPPTVVVPVEYQYAPWMEAPPGAYNPGFPVQGFRHGSGGFVDFGAGTPAILHGVERVQTPAQAASDVGERGEHGEGTNHILATLQDIRRDLRAQERYLGAYFAGDLARAVRSAVQEAG